MKKILVTVYRDNVAPRFDQASEVIIVSVDKNSGEIVDKKDLVMPAVSADELCHVILTDGVSVVVCGGIENEYYEYLNWKKVKVIDSIIGPHQKALELAINGELEPRTILATPTV